MTERARIQPTALEWLLLASGLILVNHYAWLLDDAFVFFRYADNFALLDYGLVYNKGEFVEGFTSPAWTLLLSLLRTTGLDYWPMIRLLGLAAFAGFWWMSVVLNRDLSPRGTGSQDGPPIVNFPLAYLSLNYAVLCYFTSGVEAPLVQLCALAYALHFTAAKRLAPAVLVGLSPLIRPELALALALTLTWTWVRTRHIPWNVVVPAIVGVGGWILFRVYYYAELLPNTFYLKDTSNWSQGLVYLHETLSTYGVYWLALLAAGLLAALRSRRVGTDNAPRIAMAVVAGAIALYFVRVGGDPRHYRYLAFSFCLGTAALGGLAERGIATFAPALSAGGPGKRIAFAIGLATALLIATRYPPQLGAHPVRGDVPHEMVHGINDAAYHRNHERLAISPWSLEHVQKRRPKPLAPDDYGGVSNASWCEWIYRIPNVRVIHNLGLTDALLARVDIEAVRPGHKSGLQPMAAEMEAIHKRYTPGPGMYRLAAREGVASDWMVRNLDTIEILERKIYNQHRILENLGLAFTFPPRIKP